MNKYKKIAMAVVSTVMAGAMVFGMTACGDNDGGGGGGSDKERSTDIPTTRFNASGSAIKNKSVNGTNISVLASDETKLAYPAGTTVNVNIIDSANLSRKISYDNSQIATKWDAFDGYTYYGGDLKPAWWQFGQTLGIKFQDKAKAERSGKEIETVGTNNEWADYNLINGSMAQVSAAQTNLVDFSKYLDYMPNFKAFLDSFAISELSLTMDASGAMYYLPYYDGNDDIEKYVLAQRSWVRQLLDDDLPAEDTSVSFGSQASTKGGVGTGASVEAFMGNENWSVIGGDGTTTIYVNYTAALADAQDTGTDGAMGKILKDAGIEDGTISGQSSGNIIDIMNTAINGKTGDIKGSVLLKLLRRYIDVTYVTTDSGNTKFYAKRSDVFNGLNAAWDADLMTAMFRCVVTNYKSIKGLQNATDGMVYALAGREMKAQRENDLISFAGELYGVRGLESRLEYTYIDKDGNLQDARLEEASYGAALKLNALAKEGLLSNKTNGTSSSTVNKYFKDPEHPSGTIAFMLHDYDQTQTSDAIKDPTGTAAVDFDFAPILTPVSKWNDGTEKIMRFTESWRGVKNSGVVVPKASVTNANVFSAVLSFIDYLYSNDGQIVGSYGPMSTTGNTNPDGFWYGNPVTETVGGVAFTDGKPADAAQLATCTVLGTNDGVQYFVKDATAKKTYFMYDNVLYKADADHCYKSERAVPILTTNNKTYYEGGTVNGTKMDTSNTVGYKMNHVGSYTDYARGVVGAALPIGNKDQSFEWQCTAECGIDGANVVSQALANGAIKHLTQDIDEENWWYTMAPSCQPVSSSEATSIAQQTWLMGESKTVGLFNPTSSAGYTNVYIDLAFYGLNPNSFGSMNSAEGTFKPGSTLNSVNDLLTWIKGGAGESRTVSLADRVQYYQTAWGVLKTVYNSKHPAA